MARPALPIGSWGEISTWIVQTDDGGNPTKYKSQARYRDHDGHLRPVSAYAKTKTAAKRALLQKLQDRAKTSQAGELTAMHRIREAIELWEAKFAELVAEGHRSPTSLDTYRRSIKTTYCPLSANSASARPTRLASTRPSPRSRSEPAPRQPAPAAASSPASWA